MVLFAIWKRLPLGFQHRLANFDRSFSKVKDGVVQFDRRTGILTVGESFETVGG